MVTAQQTLTMTIKFSDQYNGNKIVTEKITFKTSDIELNQDAVV